MTGPIWEKGTASGFGGGVRKSQVKRSPGYRTSSLCHARNTEVRSEGTFVMKCLFCTFRFLDDTAQCFGYKGLSRQQALVMCLAVAGPRHLQGWTLKAIVGSVVHLLFPSVLKGLFIMDRKFERLAFAFLIFLEWLFR